MDRKEENFAVVWCLRILFDQGLKKMVGLLKLVKESSFSLWNEGGHHKADVGAGNRKVKYGTETVNQR